MAMDFEKYGSVRVVKVERVEEYQQMTMGDSQMKKETNDQAADESRLR